MAKKVNSGESFVRQCSFTQTADIVLGGHEWVPIGDGFDNHTFSEMNYYGNGHKIKGLTISKPSIGYFGLFGVVEHNSWVTNVTLEFGDLNGGFIIGSIAGKVSYDSAIKNCKSNVNIKGGYICGGIVGDASLTSSVESCYYSGNIETTGLAGGGIVGEASDTNIDKCTFDGSVGGERYIGGIVGYAVTPYRNTISNCIAKGFFWGKDCIGCFAGNFAQGNIKNCAGYGYIKYSGQESLAQLGTFVGYPDNTTIEGCSFVGTALEMPFSFVGSMDSCWFNMAACYMVVNQYQFYDDPDSDWANYFGLVAGLNDDLPMQKTIFSISDSNQSSSKQIFDHLLDLGFQEAYYI